MANLPIEEKIMTVAALQRIDYSIRPAAWKKRMMWQFDEGMVAGYLSIVDVKPLKGFKLALKFENGEKRVFDMTPYLKTGKFAELNKVSIFNSVKVKFDTIEWRNKLDLDPEMLYRKSVRRPGK